MNERRYPPYEPPLYGRSLLIEKFANSDLGKAMVAHYGAATAGEKFWYWASLGQPFFSSALRVMERPEFWKGAPALSWYHPPGSSPGVMLPRFGDVVKAVSWAMPRLRQVMQKHPRLGQELAKKEPLLKSVVKDIVTDPSVYIPYTPVRIGLQRGLPLAGKGLRFAGGRLAEAVERRAPELRLWLSRAFVRPEARLPNDAEMRVLFRRAKGAMEAMGGFGKDRAEEARSLLKGLSGKEQTEVAWLMMNAEDLAQYKRLVNEGVLAPASSNKVIKSFVRMRRLAQDVYKTIPGRQRIPGREISEAAHEAENRLLRKVVGESGEITWINPETGSTVVRYRKGYWPRVRVQPPAEPVAAVEARPMIPSHRFARRELREAIELNPVQVENDLAKMLARGKAELSGDLRDSLAKGLARSRDLAVKGYPIREVKNAADIFRQMEEKFGSAATRESLNYIIRFGQVLRGITIGWPKKIYTVFNPAWYAKNAVDTQVFKSWLAGVSPEDLWKYAKTLPKDVFGKEMNFGGIWGREVTEGWKKPMGNLAKAANWVENTGRNALGGDAYWKKANSLRGRGWSLEAIHQEALAAGQKAVGEAHFNYDNLSKFDEIIRHIIPFWTYESNQMAWLLRQLPQHPRAAIMIYRGWPAGEVYVPGTRMKVHLADPVSFGRFMKTAVTPEFRGKAGILATMAKTAEGGGFYLHPILKQLGGLEKVGLLDDRSWEAVVPFVESIAKVAGKNVTYAGIRQLLLPKEGEGREPALRKAFDRRIMQRQAFSVLEGKPMTLAQARKYVLRESQLAGALSFIGVFAKVREPKYEQMKALEKKYNELPWSARNDYVDRNPALQLWLWSKEKK